MRLSTTGIAILRGNKDIWTSVKDALGVKRDTMYKYVRENNEELTKAAALRAMREGTGLVDTDLLEEDESIGLLR